MKQILKYKYILIGLFIIILIACLLKIINNKITIKEYKNDYYYLKYDSTWKLKRNNKKLILTGKESKIIIDKIALEEKYRYLNIEELSIIAEKYFSKENTSYKQIAKEQNKITKYQYDGIKLLYEDKKAEKQSLIELFKKNNDLIIIHYSSTDDYFDIKLDSVKEIIYQLKILDIIKSNTHKPKLKETDISWKKNYELTEDLTTKEEEIFANHYQVVYDIPKKLISNSYYSNKGIYTANLKHGSIEITTNVVSSNVYEILEKYNQDSKKYNYKSLKKENNYKSYLTTYNNGYLYKHTYTSKLKKQTETYVILYPINKSHTFIITVDTRDLKMPKEFLDSIKIKKVHNYANHLTAKVEDGYLTGTLKIVNNNELNTIKIKLPQNYQELDKSNTLTINSYETKYFKKDNISVEYNLLKGKVNDRVKIKKIDYKETTNINGKKWLIYENKDNKQTIVYSIIGENIYLEIIINSNRVITKQLLKDLTNYSK